jgi:molybdopterin-biosynthesis enzyme MoeA-like protein
LFGAYIIGDEILVGKRQDKHFPFVFAGRSISATIPGA